MEVLLLRNKISWSVNIEKGIEFKCIEFNLQVVF